MRNSDNTDQYLYWSATNGTLHNILFATKTKNASETASKRRHVCFAWFSNRTLQTLRQSTLSLCSRPWAWSQILSFRQRTGQPPVDDIRSASLQRQCRTSPGKLSKLTSSAHSTRRNQSRAATAARKALALNHGITPSKRRLFTSRRLYRQYDVFFFTRPNQERRL